MSFSQDPLFTFSADLQVTVQEAQEASCASPASPASLVEHVEEAERSKASDISPFSSSSSEFLIQSSSSYRHSPSPLTSLDEDAPAEEYSWYEVTEHWIGFYQDEPPHFAVPTKLLAPPSPLSSHNTILPRCELNIWVDASTSWGIGIIVDKHWAAWKLEPNWQSITTSPDIPWLETLAIELAIYVAIHSLSASNTEIQIHGDNLSVLHTFAGSLCRSPARSDAVRRVKRALNDAHAVLSPIFVYSENNLADPISRGIRGPEDRRLQCSFALPPAFADCLQRV